MLATLFFSLISCASTTGYVKTIKDDFDNYVINRMQSNKVAAKGIRKLELNAQKYQKDKYINYSLMVRLVNRKWFFIRKGESLVFLVDGERIGLTSNGSSKNRKVISGGTIVEKAWYTLTPEQLKKIAFATSVRGKLTGRNSFTTLSLSEANLKSFRNFYIEFVEGISMENFTTELPSESETGRYINKDKGFSIAFPKGWIKQEGVQGTTVIAMSPSNAADELTRQTITITVADLPNELSLDDAFNLSLNNMRQRLSNFKKLESNDLIIDNVKAKSLVYSWIMKPWQLKGLNYMIIKGRRWYSLSYNVKPDYYATYKNDFDNIVQSFKFEKGHNQAME